MLRRRYCVQVCKRLGRSVQGGQHVYSNLGECVSWSWCHWEQTHTCTKTNLLSLFSATSQSLRYAHSCAGLTEIKTEATDAKSENPHELEKPNMATVNCSEPVPVRPGGQRLCRWDPVFKSCLGLITMLGLPPRRGTCTLLDTISSVCKGVQSVVHTLVVSGNFHLLARILEGRILTHLLSLTHFPFPSFRGKCPLKD